MAKSLYVVSFRDQHQTPHFSRLFSTKRAAVRWARWLRSRSFCRETWVHLGGMGECLIEHKTNVQPQQYPDIAPMRTA